MSYILTFFLFFHFGMNSDDGLPRFARNDEAIHLLTKQII